MEQTTVNKIMNTEYNYGGTMTPLWAIYKDLDEKGFTPKDREWYIFCLTSTQDRNRNKKEV